jgi:hypothetical protein
VTKVVWIVPMLLVAALPRSARPEAPDAPREQQQEEEAAEYVKTPAAPYAQWLVDRVVADHESVQAAELALELEGVCRTIAATSKEDVGEKCDSDEIGPMSDGEPDVESPTEEDPVYDVTQALHDAAGNAIGAVGMDIDPGHRSPEEAMKLARDVLAEIESLIPSRETLFEAAPARAESHRPGEKK